MGSLDSSHCQRFRGKRALRTFTLAGVKDARLFDRGGVRTNARLYCVNYPVGRRSTEVIKYQWYSRRYRQGKRKPIRSLGANPAEQLFLQMTLDASRICD